MSLPFAYPRGNPAGSLAAAACGRRRSADANGVRHRPRFQRPPGASAGTRACPNSSPPRRHRRRRQRRFASVSLSAGSVVGQGQPTGTVTLSAGHRPAGRRCTRKQQPRRRPRTRQRHGACGIDERDVHGHHVDGRQQTHGDDHPPSTPTSPRTATLEVTLTRPRAAFT